MKQQKNKQPNKKPAKAASLAPQKNYWAEITLGVIILFVIYVRNRLISMPLERDEGEYAYFGQLMLKGIAPYVEAYNMKFPGTYFCYAVIELLFGQTISGIHFGLLLVNVAAIVMIFFMTKKLIPGAVYAVIASGVFALISISYVVLGFAAHATHFVVLFALGGLLLLYRAMEKEKIWLFIVAGFVTGMAYMSKQSGIFFVAFGGILLLISIINKKPFNFVKLLLQGGSYIGGALLPFLLAVALLWKAGSLDTFYFWAFKYAKAYGSIISISQAPELFKMNFQGMWNDYGYFFLIAPAGVIALFFVEGFLQRAITVALFALFSFLAVATGFYFRQHYFVQLLPALGIGVAAACYFFDYLVSGKFKRKPLLFIKYIILILIAGSGISAESFYLFKEKPVRLSRVIYGVNPFPESLEVAQYLKEHTTEQDRIGIMGSEPQIFFYANRRSASGYIYTYNLMEKQPYSLQMQKEMISELEKAKPKYMLMVNVGMSWLGSQASEKHIFEWYDKYIRENYQLTALSDIDGTTTGTFVTENVNSYQPKGKEYILVFQRKI